MLIRRGVRVLGLVATVVVVAVATPPGAAGPAELPALAARAGPAAPGDLDVMTFNLRWAGTAAPNPWAQRRPVMRALLTAERPHLIGTQEGLAGQLDDVEADLGPHYDYVGLGRDGGSGDEYMAIFYDNTRLAVQEHRHFWLSDTPEVPGSNTWDAGWIRMVTWVRFLDLATGARFYAVNTHLDNVSEYARNRSAALIRDRLAALDPALPIVLTGDFNAAAGAGNPVYDLFVGQAGYVDAWTAARRRGTAYGTFNGYRPPVVGGPRIDWVLTSPGVRVLAAVVNAYHDAGQYPSDHLPVQVRLRLPTP